MSNRHIVVALAIFAAIAISGPAIAGVGGGSDAPQAETSAAAKNIAKKANKALKKATKALRKANATSKQQGPAGAKGDTGATGPKGDKLVAEDLLDGAVGTQQLSDLGVTTDKLGNNAVTTPKLADQAVTTGKIGTRQVSSSSLATNSVTTSKISPGQIRGSDLGLIFSRTNTKVVGPGKSDSVLLTCSAGERLINGGGYFLSPTEGDKGLLGMFGTGETWVAYGYNHTASNQTLVVQARCLRT